MIRVSDQPCLKQVSPFPNLTKELKLENGDSENDSLLKVLTQSVRSLSLPTSLCSPISIQNGRPSVPGNKPVSIIQFCSKVSPLQQKMKRQQKSTHRDGMNRSNDELFPSLLYKLRATGLENFSIRFS